MLALTALLPLLALFPSSSLGKPISKRLSSVLIYSGRDNLCLTPAAANSQDFANGTPVISVPCVEAMTWNLGVGEATSVVAAGTEYVLDAGSNPANGGALKLWQSYSGLAQQTWYLTGDNRLAIYNGDQCLDEGDNGIQTWQCTTGNTNQVFYTVVASPYGGTYPSPETTIPYPASETSMLVPATGGVTTTPIGSGAVTGTTTATANPSGYTDCSQPGLGGQGCEVSP